MERRQSQKQSALNQLAKKGLVTTNPTSVQKALAELSPNTQNKSTIKKGARRRRHAKKTHKKNRKSYF